MHIIGVTGQAHAGKDVVADRLVQEHGYVQLALADPIKRFGATVFGFDTVQLWGAGKNMFDPRFTECELRSAGIKFMQGASLASIRRACSQGWGDAAAGLMEHGAAWVKDLVDPDDQESALADLYFWQSSLGHHYPELSPRICLQSLGVEWGREAISESIWIDKLLKDAKVVLAGYVYDKTKGVLPDKGPKPKGVVVSDVRFGNEIEALRKAGGKIIRITRPSTDKKAATIGIVGHASEVEQASFREDMFDCLLSNDKSLKDLHANVDVVAAAFSSLD